MNYSEELKEQLESIKSRDDKLYENIFKHKDNWMNQKFYDKWQIDILEQIIPYIKSLEKDKKEVSDRCEEYAKTLDSISFS